MDSKLVMIFMMKKEELAQKFSANPPGTYKELVTEVIKTLNPDQDSDLPDFERVTEIDDGHYQGTLLYVIGAAGYQPSTYWYVKVDYGSCSGCDSLQSALEGLHRTQDLITLALHIIQKLKEI